jgi:hypothetical protein
MNPVRTQEANNVNMSFEACTDFQTLIKRMEIK